MKASVGNCSSDGEAVAGLIQRFDAPQINSTQPPAIWFKINGKDLGYKFMRWLRVSSAM
jgi:hypothetical protein